MRASLLFLAVLALVAAGATIGFQVRDALVQKGAKAKPGQGYSVTATRGYESSTGGWETGRFAEQGGASTCVTIAGMETGMENRASADKP